MVRAKTNISRKDAKKCLEKVSSKLSISKDKIVQASIPKRKPKILIEGPMEILEFYSAKYKKRVYLLGETHTIRGDCGRQKHRFSAVDFIYDLITSTDKFVDVFIEAQFISKAKPIRRSKNHTSMVEVSIMLKNCLSLQKKCEYKNLRAHYSDIRGKASDNFASILYRLTSFGSSQKGKSAFMTKLIEGLEEDTENILKLQKQIKNVKKYPEVVSYIEEILLTKAQERALINDIIFATTEEIKIQGSQSKAWVDKVMALLLYQASLMDAYIMARMFRSFRHTPGKYSGEPKNIIIYAGRTHINAYAKFLKHLKFSQIHSLTSDLKGCVDVTSLYPIWNKIK